VMNASNSRESGYAQVVDVRPRRGKYAKVFTVCRHYK
jgi:hypothetical protein